MQEASTQLVHTTSDSPRPLHYWENDMKYLPLISAIMNLLVVMGLLALLIWVVRGIGLF